MQRHDLKPGQADLHQQSVRTQSVRTRSVPTAECDATMMSRSSTFAVAPLLGVLCLAFVLSPLGFLTVAPTFADETESSSSSSLAIELGTVLAVPSDDEILIPVFVSSPESVTTFQMGLDYEDVLLSELSTDDVVFEGTDSEGLDTTVTVDTTDPTVIEVTVEYEVGLEAGSRALAGYLRFDIDRAEFALSEDSSANVQIAVDAGVAGAVVNGVEADSTPGVVTILQGDAVRVGEVQGNSFGQILVPVTIWGSGELSTYEMGLDYEDVLCSRIETDGGALDPTVNPEINANDYTLEIVTTQNGETINLEMLNGKTIPFDAGSGTYLFSLVMDVPVPMAGLVPLTLTGITAIDGAPTENLLSGQIELLDEYVRGDVDFSGGSPNIVDAIKLVGYVTQGSPQIPCLAAGNVNGTGPGGEDAVDLADVIVLLELIFLGGDPLPPEPFPNPGPSPESETLPCLQ